MPPRPLAGPDGIGVQYADMVSWVVLLFGIPDWGERPVIFSRDVRAICAIRRDFRITEAASTLTLSTV